MKSSWTVHVDGRNHLITIEAGEKSTHVVRVDGRIVARPLKEDDFESRFSIGEHQYVLSRTAIGTWDLIPARVLGKAQAPVPDIKLSELQRMGRPLTNMAKFAWAGVGLLLLFFVWVASGVSYTEHAEERVSAILRDLKDGNAGETGISRSLWERDMPATDVGVPTERGFYEWRIQKGLTGAFKTYRIVGSKRVWGQKVRTAIVTFEAGGQTLRVIVPDKQPIRWAD